MDGIECAQSRGVQFRSQANDVVVHRDEKKGLEDLGRPVEEVVSAATANRPQQLDAFQGAGRNMVPFTRGCMKRLTAFSLRISLTIAEESR